MPVKRTVVRYGVVEFWSYGSKPKFLLLICAKLLTSYLLKIAKAIGKVVDQAALQGLLPAVGFT